MIIILKFENEEKYKILKMSPSHNDINRYTDLVSGENQDNDLFRTKLNRKIIEKLMTNGLWNRGQRALFDIPNQQHDWIIECLNANNIEIFLVEVQRNIFRHI